MRIHVRPTGGQQLVPVSVCECWPQPRGPEGGVCGGCAGAIPSADERDALAWDELLSLRYTSRVDRFVASVAERSKSAHVRAAFFEATAKDATGRIEAAREWQEAVQLDCNIADLTEPDEPWGVLARRRVLRCLASAARLNPRSGAWKRCCELASGYLRELPSERYSERHIRELSALWSALETEHQHEH